MNQELIGLRQGGARTLPSWRLNLREAWTLTPLVRRLRFDGGALEGQVWIPGQDLMLNLPEAPRRHYTIRSLTAGSLDIDFVLHGHGPAAAWARDATPGAEIEALGPRGRTRLAQDAALHLFVGDETCIPAIFAMIESLPAAARAWAFIEIESLAERQEVETAANLELEWLVRGGPAQPNDLLLDRLRAFDIPRDGGQAYVIGETSGVRAQRHLLLDRGWERERIAAEGYWRPGRTGGHDHV
jgi:NADPH-dependent ferric siderophore reductase